MIQNLCLPFFHLFHSRTGRGSYDEDFDFALFDMVRVRRQFISPARGFVCFPIDRRFVGSGLR